MWFILQSVNTKALVVRCHAVRDGKAPVKWLSPCLDGILTADITGEKTLLCVFVCIIYLDTLSNV